MTGKSTYIGVGVFVLVLTGVFIWGLLWISAGGPPKQHDLYLVYMTESVSGLNVDSAVKYKGVNVGRVKEMGLNPRNPEEVRLLLEVLQGTPIRSNTVVTLEYQGLTGIASLDLSGTSLDAPPLETREGEDYPIIASKPSLLARLDQTVSDLMAALTETANRISELLNEENRQLFANTLVNIQNLTANLSGQSSHLAEIVEDLKATISNARQATDRFPALVGQVERTAASIERMAEELAETGSSLEQTVSAAGEDVQRFTDSALPEAANLVVELRQAAENLRRLSETLERDPSVLVFGPPEPKPGPGEQ